jgi:hypothetical protein
MSVAIPGGVNSGGTTTGVGLNVTSGSITGAAGSTFVNGLGIQIALPNVRNAFGSASSTGIAVTGAGGDSTANGAPATNIAATFNTPAGNATTASGASASNFAVQANGAAGSAAISGGTVNNYSLSAVLSTGTAVAGGTANNYGIFLTGNGGSTATGTVNNYALYSASTAPVYLAGLLGIGVTAPAHLLDARLDQAAETQISVQNSNGSPGAVATVSAFNGTSFGHLSQTGTGYTGGGIIRADATVLYASGAGGLTLATSVAQPIYFSIQSTERMRIDTSGNVLVGLTTNPAVYKVAVNGGLGLTLGAGTDAASGGGGFWLTQDGGSTFNGVGLQFNAGKGLSCIVGNTTAWVEAWRTDTSGRVLIGATAASGAAKLQVSGTAAVGHLAGGGAAPTLTAGTGAGTAPTLAVTGTDVAGEVSITAGSSPGATATAIVTINFAVAYATVPYVVLGASNANAGHVAAAGIGWYVLSKTTAGFTIAAAQTALTAASVYLLDYVVSQ